eukprot:CAMPEP_0206592670 /NCGR_PEP_ID=MMETSP0325_2-20121206/41121_1 /ASSEMBLY_ACC=CAM_ASM_000347 /TAXON_ID=2866 /ORGANISM="Crypthecodinium cohnii, Strain Seligo" /LENGTH=113 /DNA_ID=CAMNT_0054102393 /DNA_START=168 /DNA_END=510 /DNA_ORIENTATION=-
MDGKRMPAVDLGALRRLALHVWAGDATLAAGFAGASREGTEKEASERASGEEWGERLVEGETLRGAGPSEQDFPQTYCYDAILARRAEGSQAREDAMQTAIRCKTGDGREAKG